MSETHLDTSFEKGALNWLYAGDPIIRLLARVKVTPMKMWIVAFLLVFVFGQLIYSWVTGHLFSTPEVIGALNDWASLFFGAVTFPSIWAFYVWMPRGIIEVFHRLKQNGVLSAEQEKQLAKALLLTGGQESPSVQTIDRVLRFLKRMSDRYVWISLSIFFNVAFLLFGMTPLLHEYPKRWHTVNLTYFFVFNYPVTGLLIGVLLATMAVRQALVICWFTTLFRALRVNIRPFYPDNCGGLKPLGDYSMKIAFLVSIMGFDITIVALAPLARGQPFQWTSEVVVYYVFYFLLAPVLFVLPLLAASQAMRTQKKQLIRDISARIENEYNRIPEVLTGDVGALDRHLDRIKNLQNLLEMTRTSFPVWPFDIGILRNFLAVTIAPLLPSLGIDLLSRVFLPK